MRCSGVARAFACSNFPQLAARQWLLARLVARTGFVPLCSWLSACRCRMRHHATIKLEVWFRSNFFQVGLVQQMDYAARRWALFERCNAALLGLDLTIVMRSDLIKVRPELGRSTGRLYTAASISIVPSHSWRQLQSCRASKP